MHTHTHTQTHARTHSLTHTHTHARTHTHTHTHFTFDLPHTPYMHFCIFSWPFCLQCVPVTSCGRRVDASAVGPAPNRRSTAASNVSRGASVLGPNPTSKASAVSKRLCAKNLTSGHNHQGSVPDVSAPSNS